MGKKKIITTCAIATGLYLAAIAPRIKNRPDTSEFVEKVFAHRGMYNNEIQENSIEAFQKAIENGYGIELDVQLSKEGQPVVFHDHSLMRLFGEIKNVDDLTVEELKEYGIPTLREVLAIVDGKVPLIVELKSETRDVSVCPIAQQVLDEYNGTYCVESFNPCVVKWYKECRPEIIRGQLATVSGVAKRIPIDFLLTNFLTRPDFIAYDQKSPFNLSVELCRKLFKAPVIGWTIQTASQWSKVADRFDSYICEGLPKKTKKNK